MPVKILSVDDELDLELLLTQYFRRKIRKGEYEFHFAHNGLEALTMLLKEKDFDAVTALSGSGPAYFAYMEEAMVEGGVKLGLKPKVARLLAEQTMYGTAKFLRESGMDLRPFIEGVCTKGGTTAAGMEKLDVPKFKQIVAATLAAAAKRSRELA